ncbi:MAG: ribonuclease H family protein [Bacteroidales bacterium]|nr:ribonuclease H family protein [Bacteroidales bacterium]
MGKLKKKFYVVWKGHKTGIFDSWALCEKAVKGFPDALFKSFENKQIAEKAFLEGHACFIKNQHSVNEGKQDALFELYSDPILKSISVDAACNMKTGEMEYQGVYTYNKELIFKKGPFDSATNNIGEFLALVHALAFCKKENIILPIYSDSKVAIKWVKQKKAATKQEVNAINKYVFELILRAENWLTNNSYDNKILKWETKAWGEIPADFGRK